MKRQFTMNVGKRFRTGDIRDYPATTWSDIANTVGAGLDEFTRDPEAIPVRKRKRKRKG